MISDSLCQEIFACFARDHVLDEHDVEPVRAPDQDLALGRDRELPPWYFPEMNRSA